MTCAARHDKLSLCADKRGSCCSPDVHLAAYSRPHPSQTFINVRVQTTGEVPAAQALATASSNVSRVCDHISATFTEAMAAFEKKHGSQASDKKAGGGGASSAAAAEAAGESSSESEDDSDSAMDED